jgi:endonuclease YncB( thermonuclease family)
MPYKIIKGTFHLTGLSRSGTPTSFQPDGDSLQFRPTNLAHLDDLEQVARPYRLTNINSVNLRFEGIDATEMHYGGSRQPSPLAEDSRDYVTGQFGMNPVRYRADGYRVLPPANDGQSGYILSKQLDFHGRPVAFVFVGSTSRLNGTWQYLDGPWLRGCINYRLISRGLVYPLFYDTLYHDLRETMRAAARAAIARGDGVWSFDWTNYWVDVADQGGVQDQYTIYPKVFRRITDFHNEYDGFDHDTFVRWLEARSENDRVWVRPEWNRTHLDNIVQVLGSRIRMSRHPEELVFVSRRG